MAVSHQNHHKTAAAAAEAWGIAYSVKKPVQMCQKQIRRLIVGQRNLPIRNIAFVVWITIQCIIIINLAIIAGPSLWPLHSSNTHQTYNSPAHTRPLIALLVNWCIGSAAVVG